MKERDGDVRPGRYETAAVAEHANATGHGLFVSDQVYILLMETSSSQSKRRGFRHFDSIRETNG